MKDFLVGGEAVSRGIIEAAWAKGVPNFNKSVLFAQPSVWARQPTGLSWQARPAFFSVFWKSEWR